MKKVKGKIFEETGPANDFEYNYDFFNNMGPKQLYDYFRENGGYSNPKLYKAIMRYANEFMDPKNGSAFLMGSDVQVGDSIYFINAFINGDEAYWRQVECGKDYIYLPLGPNKWYTMGAGLFEHALFDGMIQYKAEAPEYFRRCTQSEISQGNMLDYIDDADKAPDGMFKLNSVNESKKQVIRLKESQLKNFIKKVVTETLNENKHK